MRMTTGRLLHRRRFAELGKREPWQGALGVLPEGEVGWAGGPSSERGGMRMKSDGERAAGVGEGKPRHPRAASAELTQVVIVFLLALFRQGSALSICNRDPQRHPEGTRLCLAPRASQAGVGAPRHPAEPPSPPVGTGQPRSVLALAVTTGSPPALGPGTYLSALSSG